MSAMRRCAIDLRIIMMTLKVVLRGRVSSQEMLADTEQVQGKNVGLEANLEANDGAGTRPRIGVAGSVRFNLRRPKDKHGHMRAA